MTDIVDRLRGLFNREMAAIEAADEIERLRGYLDEVRAELAQVYEKMWERGEAYKRQIEVGSDQIEKLRTFAKEVIRGSWEGNLDGGDIQEMAEKHGLLKPEIYDPAKHGENCDFVPGEDTIYVFTDWMKGTPK